MLINVDLCLIMLIYNRVTELRLARCTKEKRHYVEFGFVSC